MALVRAPARAGELRELGCELVEGDLSESAAIARGTAGCDAVFHIGAMYKVGIPKSEHAAMYDANVRGTERVLDAATEAGAARIVYVSTGNVYGNTRGRAVDEGYERPLPPDFLSYYDETKYLAHERRAGPDRQGCAGRDRAARAPSTVPAIPPRSAT